MLTECQAPGTSSELSRWDLPVGLELLESSSLRSLSSFPVYLGREIFKNPCPHNSPSQCQGVWVLELIGLALLGLVGRLFTG